MGASVVDGSSGDSEGRNDEQLSVGDRWSTSRID